MATRIAVLDGGKLQQVGTPREIYERPANVFVARFVGSPAMNVLDGTLDGGVLRVGNGRLPVASGLPVGDGTEITVGIRPEHLVAAEGNDPGFEASVVAVEWLGHEQVVSAVAGDATIAVRSADASSPIAIGSTMRLTAEPGQVHVFDRTTRQRLEPASP